MDKLKNWQFITLLVLWGVSLFLLGAVGVPQTTIPTGLTAAFQDGTCPTGWVEDTTMRGRYPVGLPLSGTNAGTIGTALTDLENRATGQHLHSVDPPSTAATVTDPGHNHQTTNGGSFRTTANVVSQVASGTGAGADAIPDTNSKTTGITASVDIAAFNSANTGGVVGTNAPAIQRIFCKKS